MKIFLRVDRGGYPFDTLLYSGKSFSKIIQIASEIYDSCQHTDLNYGCFVYRRKDIYGIVAAKSNNINRSKDAFIERIKVLLEDIS